MSLKHSIMNWIPLTEVNQLDEIKALSYERPVLIFKHSTRCGISRNVLAKFEKATTSFQETIAFYFLDLLHYRKISNEISSLLDIAHQSPQILLLKNGEVVAHHSHADIIYAFDLVDFV